MLSNPKKDTEFRLHNNRLCLFHKASDHIDYWKEYWEHGAVSGDGAPTRSSHLLEFNDLFNKYISPKDERIVLEAGCGSGMYVNAFHSRGNKVVGIDYEAQVINKLKHQFPDIDYRHGNILDLQFENNSIGHYVSLGVLEHFEDGAIQHKAFEEAYRVVNKDGLAFISVPYLNPARNRHLQQIAKQENGNNDYNFHQYYYSVNDFSALLRRHGFEVIETFGYSCQAFLNREVPFFRWSSSKMPWRIKNELNKFLNNTKSDFIRNQYAHMMMYVCKKH
ncbi:MAG: class I SAM-dependent methyltransferase [Sphingobacteriales bacterium]|nr:MAG: class I SAM-dependent methyltransferase [Sphingobacteriales bacterium]